MCGVLAVSAFAIVSRATPASAQELPEPAHIKLFVDVDERDVRIDSKTFHRTCSGPCYVDVPPGYYTVTTPSATKEVYVDRPTQVRLTRGYQPAKTISLALLIGGAAVAVAALLIPILVCRDTRSMDVYGRYTTSKSICENVSTPVKIVWIAAAGAGLTVGLVGGIGLALSGPHISTSDWNAAAPAAPSTTKRSLALTPFVPEPLAGARVDVAAGAAVRLMF